MRGKIIVTLLPLIAYGVYLGSGIVFLVFYPETGENQWYQIISSWVGFGLSLFLIIGGIISFSTIFPIVKEPITLFRKIFNIAIATGYAFLLFWLALTLGKIYEIPIGTLDSETSSLNNPASYIVEANQTGGIGSHVFTANIQSDMGDRLVPTESFVHVSFKSPGELNPFGGEPDWVGSSDSMWVGCSKDGYVLTHAQSPTGNRLDTYLMGVSQMMVGMMIGDGPNNEIQITCEKE